MAVPTINSPTATSTPEQTDIILPIITLVGSSTIELLVGSPYIDDGATAYDETDGELIVGTAINGVPMSPIVLDTTFEGSYLIMYTATDAAGNTGTATREIEVVAPAIPEPAPAPAPTPTPIVPEDTEAPVITLSGPATIDIETGTIYTDQGAEATDNVDGDITSSITIDNTVDTSVAGTYVIMYSVLDSAGNIGTAERMVVVTDPIPEATVSADPVASDPSATTSSEVGFIN